jgi:lysophospholipase L1-like esterase
MRRIAYSATSPLHVALAAILFISTLPVYSQPIQGSAAKRQFNLLVLGDSIAWGQGLRDEHKAWYQVKTWLEKSGGRKVSERVEAHSGAVIGSPGDSGGNPVPELDGEVNRGLPSVNHQIDDAMRSYADPAQVDLVLVDGCINDLDARRLLNAANTAAGIRELAEQKCGPPMEALLGRLTKSFSNAHVIVTGYYPILSEKTSSDLFMRALAKKFYTGTERMNDKQLRARLIAISKEWYEGSNQMLAAAAGKIDAQLTANGSRQRVLFAEVGFQSEHSFAAPQSRLWGFDASFLRKLLVILALGRVTLKTNDERRNQRGTVCRETFQRSPGETRDQRRVRENRIMLCRLAAIGHPNREGAQMYADAISDQVKVLINSPGWIRDLPVIVTPANTRP